MASGCEMVLVDVLARLKTAGRNWPAAEDVRRAHRTDVPRSKSPAVHLVDGDDEPTKSTRGDCATRQASFTVCIYVRDDAGPAAADALKIEVMRRLSPYTTPYDSGVNLNPGRIRIETEIADLDVIEVNMEFAFSYPAAEWSL